jgi:hypothetical protein
VFFQNDERSIRMSFNIVFLNSSGGVAGASDRTSNCISVSTMRAGSLASMSVTVENTGDAACPLCTIEFFLKTTAHAAQALPASLCLPHANPMAPSSLNPGDSLTFALQYTVQSGDVGSGIVYAQIQTQSPPPVPPIDPTNMTLTCNAERKVNILPASLSLKAISAPSP